MTEAGGLESRGLVYHGAWGVTKALSPLCLSVPICRMRCVTPVGSESPPVGAARLPAL